jgi:hypothetical protein
VAIEQTVDEVQIARSAAACADGQLAGQMRLGTGGECGDLLVPDMEPFDLALTADGIRQPVEAVADDAVDALDAYGGEGFDELVSYSLCHGGLYAGERRPAVAAACRGLGVLARE